MDESTLYSDAPLFRAFFSSRREWTRRQYDDRLVVSASEITTETAPMGVLQYYLSPPVFPDRALTDWHVFVMDVQKHTGKHTHQGGVVIYVIEGAGYSIYDGLREDWEAGDLLMLPIRPGGVSHQFFNVDPEVPCRWVAAVHLPTFNQLGSQFTQEDYAAGYTGHDEDASAVSQVSTPIESERGRWDVQSDGEQVFATAAPPEPVAVFENGGERVSTLSQRNLYDDLMQLRDYQRGTWKSRGLSVVKGASLPWETNPWGVMRWYMHPIIYDTCIRSHIVYEQRIAPGSRSGKMRHQGNSILFVSQGEGYSTVDGDVWEWQANDVVQLPARPAGIEFQHVNSGSTEVRLVGFELNTADSLSVDRGCGLENVEPCPEYGR